MRKRCFTWFTLFFLFRFFRSLSLSVFSSLFSSFVSLFLFLSRHTLSFVLFSNRSLSLTKYFFFFFLLAAILHFFCLLTFAIQFSIESIRSLEFVFKNSIYSLLKRLEIEEFRVYISHNLFGGKITKSKLSFVSLIFLLLIKLIWT